MKKTPLIILSALIAAQLAVPFSMIKSRETVLRKGRLYRFKTRPIDPADPFQGRYVRLRIENDFVPGTKEEYSNLKYKAPVYAVLETGDDGFAQFSAMSRFLPQSGDFLKTRYRGSKYEWNPTTKKRTFAGRRIDIPFNRFYMDEAKAPRAEKIVRDSSRETNCWVNVRIYNGKAVIEDVFAEGKSLRELAQEPNR